MDNPVIIHQMGFPTWTLWGMGLSALGALIAIGLSLVGQSPRFARRTGLSGYRLDLRVRAFTSYGFALLLLALGFFLAGVPLDAVPVAEGEGVGQEPTATNTRPPQLDVEDVTSMAALELTGTPAISPTLAADVAATRSTPITGAFGAPLETETATPAEVTPLPEPTAPPTPEPSPTAEPTGTPSPTPTDTPAPTETPTLTPTPIEGPTGIVNTAGSTLWLRRLPGGQNLVLVRNGDTLILLPGRANQGGILWQEVSTVEGVTGWVQLEFLNLEQ